jgi:protein TonB
MAFLTHAPFGRSRSGPPQERPPLRPQKIYPIATAAVIAAHAFVFAAFMQYGRPQLLSLGEINAELVPEGDFFEAEAISETDVAPEASKPEEAREEPEIAVPAPTVPVREAPRLPVKKEVKKAEKSIKPKTEKSDQERRNVASGDSRREGQARRRYGAPGGRGAAGSGASQATCLAHVAAALRRHTPGATSLGPGSAFVTFHISAGGGISGVTASGSTPEHAALARRIVAASRGPSTCGAAFVSQNVYFE